MVYTCESRDGYDIGHANDWSFTPNTLGTYLFDYDIFVETDEGDVSAEYTVAITVTVHS